jgi:hypothetical protein
MSYSDNTARKQTPPASPKAGATDPTTGIAPDDTTDDDITILKLAVDAAEAVERAYKWSRIAISLANALTMSGWLPQSGGTKALDDFMKMLRSEAQKHE